jgi:glutaredoxin
MSYISYIKNVPGDNSKKLLLFTLSTCIWCNKTKALLKDCGIAYDYVDVDLLTDADQNEAYEKMWQYNPSTSFPTIVINDGEKLIIGFNEEEIKNLKK